MNSSMIGKIEKAHRYAQEHDRVSFNSFEATIRGDNDSYQVNLTPNGWNCSCPTYRNRTLETCSHIMTMQLILGNMLKDKDRYHPQHGLTTAE